MNLYVFHVFPYLSFQPLTHKRLQLEDPSSAPQLDPFVGTFSLATAAPGPRMATAGPEATAKVCRALEGYAMQGTKQQLAKELLMEAMEMKMVVEICWDILCVQSTFQCCLFSISKSLDILGWQIIQWVICDRKTCFKSLGCEEAEEAYSIGWGLNVLRSRKKDCSC